MKNWNGNLVLSFGQDIGPSQLARDTTVTYEHQISTEWHCWRNCAYKIL